jgi:hypothetical protein
MSSVLQPRVSATVTAVAAIVAALTSTIVHRPEQSAPASAVAEQTNQASAQVSVYVPNGTRFATEPFAERWRNSLITPAPKTSPPVLESPEPITVAMADTSIAPVAPVIPHKARAALARDRVCGDKGRQWYTKANGWRYWRCIR